MSRSGSRWTRLCELDEVPEGGLRPVTAEGHKLVVARPVKEALAVLDNRCPHEGYPLSQGQLDGGTLTCCWHNWKFNTADGRCLLGGEDARSWPCRVDGGVVFADVSEPDPATVIPGLLESLRTGLFRYDPGRTVRDGIRLLQLGLSPRRLALEIAVYDAGHAEYGATHVLALAADCVRGLSAQSGPQAMVALAPVIDLCGESNRRLPPRKRAAALSPLPAAVGQALRAAVAAEDVEGAQALLAGAFEDGARWPMVERWLLQIASDHFTDFGHQLIYLTKVSGLLGGSAGEGPSPKAGPGQSADPARELALGLLDSLLFATREDTLPYMGRYSRRLSAMASELSDLYRSLDPQRSFDGVTLRGAVLDGSADEALEALEAALRAGVCARNIARELVVAGAHRLLRFEVSLDSDPSCMEGWLWASHRFTFAAAVRAAVETLHSPDTLRFLYQAVAFIHSGRAMDNSVEERLDVGALDARPVPTGPVMEAQLEQLLVAIGQRQSDLAVAGARRLLASDAGTSALRVALETLCLSDPLVRPIVVTHAIKTTWAAFAEREALGSHEERDVPVLAAVRMLASPIVERRVHELVQRSIAWVVEGKVPRKLTQ